MKTWLSKYLTLYRIPRDRSRPMRTGWFKVNVEEINQIGIGYQYSTSKYDYGFSIHTQS